MRALRLVLSALLVLVPLAGGTCAQSATPPATGTLAEPPPPLPQGDDPKGGGGLG